MRIGWQSLLFAACLCWNLAAQGKEAEPDRFIPFAVSSEGVLSGTLETRFLPSCQSVLIKPRLTSQQAEQYYGLQVGGAADVTVYVNGRKLDVTPMDRPSDKLYMIGPGYLNEGENTIRLDRADNLSWAGTRLFSLASNFEIDHFGQAFWERSPDNGNNIKETPTSTAQDNYDVLWYDCTWKPSTTSPELLTGSEVTMGAKALVNSFQQVEIDFDMNVAGNGGSPMVLDYVDSGPATPALAYSYNSSTFRLTVTLPSAISAGTDFKIRIGYHGAPNNDAPSELFNTNPFYVTTHSSIPVIYSVSQPYGGRRWWPSKDHPSDKATTSIQRIVVPNNLGFTLTAVSNGVMDSITTQGINTTYTWRNDYPIATYLISIAVSNYVYRGGTYTSQDNSSTMPVGHYIYPENISSEGAGYLGTLQAMNFFAQRFGEYPFLTEKYQTATWNISWAIEHQTCTSMPGATSSGGVSGSVGNGLTRRNVHELAHQWFGDKVTCANWDHIWLHEGMATFCEALFFESLYGTSYYHDYVDGWTLTDSSDSINTPIVGPTSDKFRNALVYNRGAWVFHMLRHVLGDNAFFAGCRIYIAKGYTTAVSQPPGDPVDFQTCMEQGAGLSTGSLQNFFTQWLYSPTNGYAVRPDYKFSAAYNPATAQVNVRIGQGQSGLLFEMPVDILLTDKDANTTTVKAPMGMANIDIPLGSFVPVYAELDPDNWILKRLRANINTSSIPNGAINSVYSFTLQGSTGSGSLSWSKITGPAWVSVSSGGVISGTPPAEGTYPITVRLTNSTNTQDATFYLVIAPPPPPPPAVVINELIYEMSQDTTAEPDAGEYVELKNTTTGTVDISGWQVAIVGSSGEATAASVAIPASTLLAAGDYYVIGNASAINAVYPGAVDYNVAWNESLPDGNPGAVILKTSDGTRVDSIAYRADTPFSAGSQASAALAEGGIGRVLSAALTNTADRISLSRMPDGADSNINLRDFGTAYPTPGSANAGAVLPLSDNFETLNPQWRTAYQNPIRTVAGGDTGKPPVASPAGGRMLEVFDTTGGGDVVYLPGAFDRLNVEGYIWIPSTSSNPWSTGIAIGTRAESTWFQNSTGAALEHGYYLEFQNGTGINLKNGMIANASGQARLFVANSTACPGAGLSGFAYSVLGSTTPSATGAWASFRLFYDNPGNRLYAKLGTTEIYDGTIPAALSGLTGGLTIGFRENHSGNPTTGNTEGTWVDGLLINTNTSTDSGIKDFQLY